MKNKICFICHLTIDTEKPYCKFIHYQDRGDIQSKAYYHVECFRDRMLVNKKANIGLAKAMSFLDKAKEKLGMPDEVIIT